MKEIKLQSIELTNFRGHKATLINELTDLTTISGDNGTGKSTVFDAFLWLLFGKDQFDRKDFEIIPTSNGKMQERIDSVVEATILFDGRPLELKRTLHQKWVRPRGQAEEKYDGNETLYTWDGVDIKAGDYKARVDLMVEETIFKLITRPEAFLNLHWTKIREFLFQMSGTISDVEVLDRMATLTNKDAIFNLTNILNQGKKLTEFKKEISAKKKKAKEELETIQPRIDQTTKLMPASRDFAAIESEIKGIDNEVLVIDEQIQDLSKAIRGQYEAIQGKQIEINDLKRQQTDIVHEKESEARQNAFNANQKRTELENEVSASLRKLQECERQRDETSDGLTRLRKNKEAKEKELEQLRADWETENEKEYVVGEHNIICPLYNFVCDHPKATLNFEQAHEIGKKAFIAEKNKKLDKLDEDGAKLSEEIKLLDGRIKNGETIKTEATENVKKYDNEYDKLKQKVAAFAVATPVIVIASELAEWQELDKQIQAIKETMQDVQPVDNADLNTRKSELNQKRDGLKNDLSARETIRRYTNEIKELNARASELAQQIADLEGQEFTIDAFNKVKIEECDRRINGMFSQVRFKLFDYTNEGNEFEACIPTNIHGVPYAVTNTAEQINMGLDCISVISKFYNVQAPLFIDRSESINRPIPTGAQMILVKVTAPGTPFQVTNY